MPYIRPDDDQHVTKDDFDEDYDDVDQHVTKDDFDEDYDDVDQIEFLKKLGFDPSFTIIPSRLSVRNMLLKYMGKTNTHDPEKKNKAKIKYEIVSKYQQALIPIWEEMINKAKAEAIKARDEAKKARAEEKAMEEEAKAEEKAMEEEAKAREKKASDEKRAEEKAREAQARVEAFKLKKARADANKANKAKKANKAEAKKAGEGIYTQKKRNAYKISQGGQYGGLVIDLPKLYGHLKVVAQKNSQKVYDKQADFDTLDLLTKRFNSKNNYSELARSVFDDLNRLSEIPIHITSKKYSKVGSGIVYYNNPQDLLSRLELLGGSMSAGNNSNDVREEFVEIVHRLNKLNVIDNKQVNDLMKEYLI